MIKSTNDEYGCYDYSAYPNLKLGQTVLKVPCRSPLVVVEAVMPYIKEKVVCELGSAVGDLSVEFKKYAKSVIGVENDPERAAICKQRGIDTIFADVLDEPPLPEDIDVYYVWINVFLARKVFDSIKKGTVILAGELGLLGDKCGYPRGVEVKVLDQISAQYPESKMLEIEYNEGDGPRQSGTLVLLVVDKN